MVFGKKYKVYVLLMLVISFVFIEPYFISSVFAEGSSTNNGYTKVKDCAFSLDVKKSLIFSILTLCLPGVINRLHEWKEIKCEYVNCYYDSIQYNLDPGYCKTVKSYNECVFIFQEFLIDQVLDKFREIIDGFLRDPIMFVVSIGVIILRCSAKFSCCSGSNNFKPGVLCNAVAGAIGTAGGKACPYLMIPLAVVDVPASYARIKELIEAKDLLDFGSESACDNLEDIKKEVEEAKEGLIYEGLITE